MSRITKSADSPWPHRWAVALACATFPLVWVGGLVTTTDAGMAVPDWPNTYGYNLFLYPWQSWLAGPWDLFVEHGHRLLAAAVGLLTVGLLASLWRCDRRRWMQSLGVCALLLVVVQGVLGGLRVLLDERSLAMIHGCTGPVFFALAVAMVVFTSRTWLGSRAFIHVQSGQVRRLAVVTATLVYLQLVLGAVVRHVPVASDPTVFDAALKFHLAMAVVLLFHIGWLSWSVARGFRHVGVLAALAGILAALLVAQIGLGVCTWLVKYSVPYWASAWVSSGAEAIRADGWLQTHVVTAHVALGSLLLGTSVAFALIALRLLAAPAGATRAAYPTVEVVR